MREWVAAIALLVAAGPAFAQTPTPQAEAAATPLDKRIADVTALLNGKGSYETLFSDSFRAAVPKAQFNAVTAQLEAALGAATGPEQVTRAGPWQATVRMGFERGVATMRIVVDPSPPHAVSGLVVTGTEPRNDSVQKLAAEIAALPGEAGFGIYALGAEGVRAVHAHRGEAIAPIGSSFKLWVLAEAARQVAAGQRGWDDVVPLERKSLPSGILQDWPLGSPLTLHTLATLMISISDNTATDTLMRALGREAVDAMVARVGVAKPEATLPVLTTREAFQLKTPAQAALAARWSTLDPEARRRALASEALTATRVEPGMFGSAPVAPQVEWFASPRDMAATLDWLRREGGEEALAILAVNPGTAARERFDYIAFKGGSEPGVIALNYLVRTKDGRWFAVTGNWHREDAGVDNAKFAGLMARALNLVP